MVSPVHAVAAVDVHDHGCIECGAPCRFVLCDGCYESFDKPWPEPEQSRPYSAYVAEAGVNVVVDGRCRY